MKNIEKKQTKNGFPHGLINTLANSVDASFEKKIKESKLAEYQKQKKEDSEIIKVRYINYVGRNERLETPYMKYAGDPITIWRFLNNEVYHVPRGLVHQVNRAYKLSKKHTGLLDKDSKPLEVEEEADKIHEFVGVL